MTREEKLKKIDSLKRKASQLKKEVDYYNALQLALKLVLNGSYVWPPLERVGAKFTEHLQHPTLYCTITT